MRAILAFLLLGASAFAQTVVINGWGGSGGGGGVTSVGLAFPSTLCAISGSPVTASGTLTCSFATGQTANQIFGTDGSGNVGLMSLGTAQLPAAASLLSYLGTGTPSSTTFLRGDGTWSSTGTLSNSTYTESFTNTGVLGTTATGNIVVTNTSANTNNYAGISFTNGSSNWWNIGEYTNTSGVTGSFFFTNQNGKTAYFDSQAGLHVGVLSPQIVAPSTQAVTWSATPTYQLGNFQAFTITLAGNTTPSMSGGNTGEVITIQVCENATGGFTWTWPASFHGGMTINTTASECNTQSFISYNNGTSWWAISTGVSSL